MKAIDRFYNYLAEKSLKPTNIEKELGLSNGYLSAQKKRNADMGEGVMNKIIDYFQDISPNWLLTGEGSMFRDSKTLNEKEPSVLPISPAEESIIYKMYMEKDAKVEELLKENGRLEERIKQLELQYNDLEHKSEENEVLEAFTEESSGNSGEDSIPMKLPSTSKRLSAGKI